LPNSFKFCRPPRAIRRSSHWPRSISRIPALPDGERAQIKKALEAAAIPHWCDEKLLAALLETSESESATCLSRLRGLKVIEAFPARGENSVNVHETARLALREGMLRQRDKQFRELSTRAAAYFAGQSGPHAQIENVFQRVFAEPDSDGDLLSSLFWRWDGAGRFEELHAFGGMLAELRTFPGVHYFSELWPVKNWVGFGKPPIS
jgi:hypothetical protein